MYPCLTWFKVLWESPESASYDGAFRALKASFGKAEKRAPNLLGPCLELLLRGHRPVESGNQTSQNPPEARAYPYPRFHARSAYRH